MLSLNKLFALAFSLPLLSNLQYNIYFHHKKSHLHHRCPHFLFHPEVPRGVSARSTGVASKVRRVLRIMKEALPYAESLRSVLAFGTGQTHRPLYYLHSSACF